MSYAIKCKIFLVQKEKEKIMNDTLKLLKELSLFFFEERNPQNLLDKMTEDVYISGLANDTVLKSKKDAAHFIKKLAEQGVFDYHFSVEAEEMISEHAATLRFVIENGKNKIHYRVMGVSKEEDDALKLCILHFSPFTALSVTEQLKTQEQLKRNQELMEYACDFAGVWAWLYDIENNCIYPSKKLQKDYEMPEKLEDFPNSWFQMNFIMPDFIPLHREKVEAIQKGSKEENFECKVQYRDGSIHWARIRFIRLKDSPDMAVGISQLIDNEKILEVRIDLEKQKLVNNHSSMEGYFIVNVSKNVIVQSEEGCSEDIKSAMDKVKKHFLPEDWERYCDMHEREFLLDAYEKGTTSFNYEGHFLLEDGSLKWIRCNLNLRREPSSGDIYLYEYIYNIHNEKIGKILTAAVVKYDYIRVASINLAANEMTVINAESPENSEVFIWNYTEHRNDYANHVIYEGDRASFIADLQIENIQKLLKDTDKCEFLHRYYKEDGSIGYCRTRITMYNRNSGICLMTRTDVTKMISQQEEKAAELQAALDKVNVAAKAKSDFMARMSHDMRTPMNVIIGLASLTLDDAENPASVRDNMTKMRSVSDFLLGLVNDILDMAKIETVLSGW